MFMAYKKRDVMGNSVPTSSYSLLDLCNVILYVIAATQYNRPLVAIGHRLLVVGKVCQERVRRVSSAFDIASL